MTNEIKYFRDFKGYKHVLDDENLPKFKVTNEPIMEPITFKEVYSCFSEVIWLTKIKMEEGDSNE